jgi:flagellar motor switch protein FliN/FliY
MADEQSQLNNDELNEKPEVSPGDMSADKAADGSAEASPGMDNLEMPNLDFAKSDDKATEAHEADPGDSLEEPPKMANPSDVNEEDAEAEMLRMMQEAEAKESEPEPIVEKASFAKFTGSSANEPKNLDMLMDVSLPIAIELGRTSMAIEDILNLGPGSVVELDKLAGEPVDLFVNNKLLAKGEVVVIDENFGVRITSMISRPDRIRTLQ